MKVKAIKLNRIEMSNTDHGRRHFVTFEIAEKDVLGQEWPANAPYFIHDDRWAPDLNPLTLVDLFNEFKDRLGEDGLPRGIWDSISTAALVNELQARVGADGD